MNQLKSTSVAVLIAFVLAACQSDAAQQWATTTDTTPSGIVMVMNSPQRDAAPTWLLEEQVRIGSTNETGPALFGLVKDLLVLDDGRIVVLDAQAQEIRIFRHDGTHQVTYGGKGGGPGEFENALGMMRTRGGLIYVPDEGNARMTVLHPDRGFVTSYPLKLYRYGFVWHGTMRQDDYMLVPSMSLETRRDLIRIYRPDMVQTDSVLLPERAPVDQKDPPGAFAWQAPGGMPRGFTQVPFYPAGNFLMDRTGEVWSTAGGDPSYRIALSTLQGDTSLIIQTRRDAVPVAGSERDSAMQGILESLSRYGVRRLDASKIPAVKPAVLSLFTDDRGRLWVRTSSPDSLARFDVYERTGSLVGTLATPHKFVRWVRPVVRGDQFYAVVTDELDVPYVIRARIAPAAD